MAPQWQRETLYTSGDDFFASLLRSIQSSRHSIELETYIFEKGVLAERMAEALVAAALRGVHIRMIVDGWGSPGFIHDYFPRLKKAGIKVHFFRVIPYILRRLPGDPKSVLQRIVQRWRTINHGNHRKFCLIDKTELWVGSFNVSDVHLREIYKDAVWKDVGVCVHGPELHYAHRAFNRAYRGWTALNLPARSPRLLLLNDSFLHKRRTRLEHVRRMQTAQHRIWLATPYFVPIGRIFRLLAKRAQQGLDVRVIIPRKNDVWLMKWLSAPLLGSLAKKGVKVYVYGPRFSHQKLFIADEWICIGSTNLNHRSFLHDLEMDVVVTQPQNQSRIVEGFVNDQAISVPFDSTAWAHLSLWKRALSSVFLLLKYWA